MAFNLGTLSTYTNGYGQELVAKMVAKGQTSEVVTIHPDVKSAVSIPTHSTTLYLTAGACGWSPSGSTVMGNMVLSVDPISYLEQLCVQTLEATQLQWQIKAGSSGDDTAFIEYFMGEKIEQVALANENLAWQGSKAHGTGNNALTDGYLAQLINTSASASTVNTSGYTGISTSNVIALFDHMRTIAPAAIKTAKDLTLFCGTDAFDYYITALRTANNFFYDVTGINSAYKIRIPGYNVTVVGTVGLDGINPITNKATAVLSTASNFYLGTDLFSESNRADLWYSQDYREVRCAIMYKLGYKIMFPEFVVIHKT